MCYLTHVFVLTHVYLLTHILRHCPWVVLLLAIGTQLAVDPHPTSKPGAILALESL